MARKSDYSFEEIDLALTAYAFEGGRMRATERLLLEADLGHIPYQTVRTWAYTTHPERYERINGEIEKQVRARLADTALRLAATSAELSEDILARIKAELDRRDDERIVVSQRLADVEARLDVLRHDDTEEAEEEKSRLEDERKSLWSQQEALKVNLKELAKLLHEAAVQGGVATDKHAVLTGRPTKIVEHDFSEVKAALERKGVRLLVGQGQQSSSVEHTGATAVEPVPIERRLPPGESRDAGDS